MLAGEGEAAAEITGPKADVAKAAEAFKKLVTSPFAAK